MDTFTITTMWFASIWVFYFDIPWQLGADFFYRNLLDADPASIHYHGDGYPVFRPKGKGISHPK